MNRHGALRMCGIVAAVVDYARFGGWPVNPEVNTTVGTIESVFWLDPFALTTKTYFVYASFPCSAEGSPTTDRKGLKFRIYFFMIQ